MKCRRCGCYIPEGTEVCLSCGRKAEKPDNGCYVTFDYHGEEIRAYVERYEIVYTGSMFISGRTMDGKIEREVPIQKRRFVLMER